MQSMTLRPHYRIVAETSLYPQAPYVRHESRHIQSNIPDVFEPAFEWGEGHTLRFSVAEKLTQGRFAAPTIVVIDSCFTQAVYGRHADRHDKRRIHNMQTLHINNEKLDDDADILFLRMYESLKTTLFDIYTNPDGSFNTVRSLAENMIEFFT